MLREHLTLEKVGSVFHDNTWFPQVLLIENDINSRPFSEAVLACLPPLPWSFSEEELLKNQRQDLRHICIFSVDPIGNNPPAFLFLCLVRSFVKYHKLTITVHGCAGCKDIDDALHCTPLPDGRFEVGVRILISTFRTFGGFLIFAFA